jgi:hypothetical protein
VISRKDLKAGTPIPSAVRALLVEGVERRGCPLARASGATHAESGSSGADHLQLRLFRPVVRSCCEAGATGEISRSARNVWNFTASAPTVQRRPRACRRDPRRHCG